MQRGLEPVVVILTLSRLEAGRFFFHPARLLVFLRGRRRVEAVCPEAFSSFEEVPVCPTVPAKAMRKRIVSPACRIFTAAFSSRSRIKPHCGQMCVRTERLFLTRVPHVEQSCVVNCAGTAITGIWCKLP